MQATRPEMCGRIVDESHVKFHVECKAKVLNAINKLKKGKDFLTALSQLDFTTDKRWTKNSCNDPNTKVLLSILEEYKKVEKRPSRGKILIPLLEYAIGLYASDFFFRERGEWFLLKIIQKSPQLRFTPIADPNNWYPNKRYDGENLDGDINDDYRKWYGVDPEKDSFKMDSEREKELIESQKEHVIQEIGREGLGRFLNPPL